MTGPLRVALVAHTVDDAAALPILTAASLREAGHDPVVLSSHRRMTRATTECGVQVVRLARLPEAPLRYRGFTGPITHAPLLRRALRRGGYDVAHAFTPEDAWLVLGSGIVPVVFTPLAPLGREHLSDRRLRLRAVQAAVEQSAAVTAPTAAVAASLERWLAADADVIEPSDADAHAGVYRAVLATRSP